MGGSGGRNRSGASPAWPVKAEPEHDAMDMAVSKHLTPRSKCSTWNIKVRGRRYLPLTTPIDCLAY